MAKVKRGCSYLHFPAPNATYRSHFLCSFPSSKLATNYQLEPYIPPYQFSMTLLKIKTFLLPLLLLLILLSSGMVEGFRESVHPTHHLLYKDGMKMNSRKLLIAHDFLLDYDDAGPNPKHTKKPGGKGP